MICLITVLFVFSFSQASMPTKLEQKTDIEQFLNSFDADYIRDEFYREHIARYATDNVDLDWLTETYNADTTDNMRVQTNAIGQLAYLYAHSNIAEFTMTETLNKLKQAYISMVDHIDDRGRFTWEKKINRYGYETQVHEHAWLIEPLLIGYIWMKPHFDIKLQADIEQALFTSSKWLYEHPYLQKNNRGMTWAAILMLTGRYFEQADWIALAEKEGSVIFSHVVRSTGEVGEHDESYAGGGPDSNYSYTGLAYSLAYRLWSGDASLDESLQLAARWFTGYNTLSQFPNVAGASVRRMRVRGGSMRDLIPFYEWMASKDAFFGYQATNALSMVEEGNASAFGRTRLHILSPIVFARLLGSAAKSEAAIPNWQNARNQLFTFPQVTYLLTSREHYQTGIVLSARSGFRNDGKRLYGDLPENGMSLRGMQTWAWEDEHPIILHDRGGLDSKHSSASVVGTNTATMNVNLTNNKPDHFQSISDDGTLAMHAIQQGSITSIFAFSEASTVVVYLANDGKLVNYWHMNQNFLAGHKVDNTFKLVNFIGRNAKLFFIQGEAFEKQMGVEVVANDTSNAFGFSDRKFSFISENLNSGNLIYKDASGIYNLKFTALLGDPKQFNYRQFSSESLKLSKIK